MDTLKESNNFKFPLVSIGIPVFNEVKYIERTIISALKQTYPNIEVIISDNNSDDGTLELIKKKFKNQVILYQQRKNIGPNNNFKYLTEKANGKYFMWLGGHDFIHEKYIEEAIKIHEKLKNCSLVYFQHKILDANQQERDTILLRKICLHPNKNYKNSINIYKNIDLCTHIHGVWKLGHSKKLKYKDTIGPDIINLFIFSLLGRIYEINLQYYNRIEFRKEKFIDKLNRYKELNFEFDNEDPRFTIFRNLMNYSISTFRLKLFFLLGFSDSYRFKRYLIKKLKLQ